MLNYILLDGQFFSIKIPFFLGQKAFFKQIFLIRIKKPWDAIILSQILLKVLLLMLLNIFMVTSSNPIAQLFLRSLRKIWEGTHCSLPTKKHGKGYFFKLSFLLSRDLWFYFWINFLIWITMDYQKKYEENSVKILH